MVTGFEDDPRRTLGAEHPLYGLAWYALEQQDGWSLDQHAKFWTAALAAWPRLRGQRPLVDASSAAAAHLAERRVPLALIAETLHVTEGHLGAQRSSDTGRPSLERGSVLLRRGPSLGERLSHLAGRCHCGRPPLPRVYAAREPDFTFVNPLIELVDGALRPSPEAERRRQRAEALLERAQAEGALRYIDGTWVVDGDWGAERAGDA